MRRAVVGMLAAGALFLALETGLRRFDVGAAPSDGEWFRYTPGEGWEPKPGYSGDVYGAPRAFGSTGFLRRDEDQLAEPGQKTLLIYGDSNSFGVKVATEETFAERLDDALPDARVINLAVPGYSSYQGLARLRATLDELDPDLVVLSFNFNDRRYVLRAQDQDGAAYFAGVFEARSPNRLSSLRTVRFLSELWRGRGDDARPTRPSDPELRRRYEEGIRVDELLPRVSPQAYRENLAAAVELAATRGVPVVFLLLGDHPRQTAFLSAEPGESGAEEKRLEAAIAADTAFADLARLRLAGRLREQGRSTEAEEVLVLPKPIHSLHGGRVVHPDSVYQDILRSLAVEAGATLVDAYAVLREREEVFTDFCHFDAAGHETVFTLLLPVVRSLLDD